ncbi:ATP-binding protein [Agromyces aerolatus]|uniref:ATP-binding protein n=1 Tax=Agromyces sp. LY-1074 TaxID=3074080 RepID=UPI002860AD4C|nr:MULTISPECIES: ATP-binding protein [unclassified Agromyces]MDR5698608.1 ATP-binding protein [Agromyces sp. LY-1074]MDR5704902.1 ATP-binding protein [Agromyces sp. LY-1358]
MDRASNPYTPHAGADPEVLAGRGEPLEAFRVLLGRLRRGRAEPSMILTGLRGVGKTVLLARFAEVARGERWEPVELEAVKCDDGRFRLAVFTHLKAALLRLAPRPRWTERDRVAAEVLTAFGAQVELACAFGVAWDVPAAEGAGDSGDLDMDLADVFVAMGEAARAHERGVVLLIDEAQFLSRTQFEALVHAVHATSQRRLPITWVGAGLPHLAELTGEARSYADRLFSFPSVGPLAPGDARAALTGPALAEGVAFEEAAVQRALEITGGYPCFIQELGAQTWSVAEGDLVRRTDVELAEDAYDARLDSWFFRLRLERATPLQTAYLRAMAELGPAPQKAADVARLMGRESTQVGPIRAELIELGLLYAPEHGYAAFTAPGFDRFMLRVVPQLRVPEIQRRGPRVTAH